MDTGLRLDSRRQDPHGRKKNAATILEKARSVPTNLTSPRFVQMDELGLEVVGQATRA